VLRKRSEFAALNATKGFQKTKFEGYRLAAEEILEEMLRLTAEEIDGANMEYAEVLFKNEFK